MHSAATNRRESNWRVTVEVEGAAVKGKPHCSQNSVGFAAKCTLAAAVLHNRFTNFL